MKKRLLSSLFIACTVLLAGCGTASENTEKIPVEKSEVTAKAESEDSSEAVMNNSAIETESASEIIPDEAPSGKYGPEAGLYDRTYLEEENGVFVYRMTDADIIERYDEMYAGAFADMVAAYDEEMEWRNQGVKYEQPVKTNDLMYKSSDENKGVTLGSSFEMDYNYNLYNVGYTYVDLDSDGTFEIIFGVLPDADADWIPKDSFERGYALADGQVIKICEGGSRDLHWLGNDGYIYETGSSGAAYSGTWRLHFDSTALDLNREEDWGNNGFTEDELIGYWEGAVHINGPIEDINEAAKWPENQISEAELPALEEEWKSRQVQIDWLRLSDYLDKYGV